MSNNYANGARATEYKSWVYYTTCNRLFREKIDTGKRHSELTPEEFTTNAADAVSSIRDNLYCHYFWDCYEISPNGKKTASFNCMTDDLQWQTDGKYCYMFNSRNFDETGIYKIKNSA